MEYIYNLEVFIELEWIVIMLEKKWRNIDFRKVFFNKFFNKIRFLVKIFRFFVFLKNIGIYR